MAIRVFHRDEPSMKLSLISKDARFIQWPGTGAWTANMNYVRLEPGEANKPHVHVESEDTIFILEGAGSIQDYTNDLKLPFKAGCVVHVPKGVKHAVMADKGVEIVSVGGPCPADLPLLKSLGILASDAKPPS